MQSNKTISINPNLFNLSGRKKKETRKFRPKPVIRPNKLKQQLLKRIKEHASQNSNRLESSNDFTTDFNSHLDYLQQLSIKHKERKKTQKLRNNKINNIKLDLPNDLKDSTIKEDESNKQDVKTSCNQDYNIQSTNNNLIHENINIDLPKLEIKQAPPYGNLKNGPKPTYKEWKKSLKNYDTDKQNDTNTNTDTNINSSSNLENDTISERIKIRNNIIENNEKHNMRLPENKYRKKTTKKKYVFGKKDKIVSVLIKNNTTRKKIKDECNILNLAPINEVKDYLKKHQLYKSGSKAPNDILRQIYKDAHLAGNNVSNKSTENLVHNFLN